MTREERRAIDAAYYAANREKRLAQQAAYNASHREEKAAYRAAHKEEQAAYNAAYYHAHREELLACAAAYYQENGDAILEEQRQECAEFHEWLQILRTNNGCEDCETHSGRLLHHHVDPSTKRFNLAHMANRSLDTLEDELEQCVVLCPSCHAKHHAALRAA